MLRVLFGALGNLVRGTVLHYLVLENELLFISLVVAVLEINVHVLMILIKEVRIGLRFFFLV